MIENETDLTDHDFAGGDKYWPDVEIATKDGEYVQKIKLTYGAIKDAH